MGALFLAQEKDESRLLYDMGRETANIHFGSPKAITHVKRDLTSRRSRWLHRAAKAMYKPHSRTGTTSSKAKKNRLK